MNIIEEGHTVVLQSIIDPYPREAYTQLMTYMSQHALDFNIGMISYAQLLIIDRITGFRSGRDLSPRELAICSSVGISAIGLISMRNPELSITPDSIVFCVLGCLVTGFIHNQLYQRSNKNSSSESPQIPSDLNSQT